MKYPHLQKIKRVYNFTPEDSPQKAVGYGQHPNQAISVEGHVGESALFYQKRYSTLFLGLLKPGKFQISVKDETTVDAYVDMHYDVNGTRERAVGHYSYSA